LWESRGVWAGAFICCSFASCGIRGASYKGGGNPTTRGLHAASNPRTLYCVVERESKAAVVLLSGGMDSATALAIARDRGFRCYALSFDYGQRHRFELDAARRIAASLGAAEHRIVKIDLSAEGGFGKSALTDSISVPKDRADSGEIPVTYVPARNTIFLSIALGYAEVIGAFDIFIGVNAIDYSGYPDCRPEFVDTFQRLANLATAAPAEGRGRFTIHAPLIQMTKEQIIRTGLGLGVDYSLTHSCYDPAADGAACGRCDACRLRLAGFAEAGQADPLPYVERGYRSEA
jgi:7-cyano-7-deazaguanine synthase